MRQKRIGIAIHKADGVRRHIASGIVRFANSRVDWGLRWHVLEEQGAADGTPNDIDGLIWITDQPQSIELIQNCSSHAVIAGCCPSATNISAVFCDPALVGVAAAQHLRELGHQHLSCLSCEGEIAQQQLAGFAGAARQYDIEPEMMCNSISADEPSGRRDEVIAAWLRRLPRRTGIFVTCDRLAANACEVARANSIAIPDDVAVVTAGNDPDVAAVARPTLSTVEQSWEQIGFQAAALLMEVMSGEPGRRIVLQPLRVTRCASSETFACDDAKVREAVEFIRQNAHRPIGVRDVLKHVLSSRRSLEQRFRRAIQRTIMDEIRRARLDLAMKMLLESEASLRQIAVRCGLGNSTQLGQLTRRYTGLTPLELRQRFKR